MAKRLYQTKAGETLKSIAATQLQDETRWQELAYINSISHPYIITPGQLLLVPSPDDALTVTIVKDPTAHASASPSDFMLSPAELGWLAAGVALIWYATRQ